MANLFDIANLITTVGVEGVKIKQEPGVPEKSSNEILTELFSTFDVEGGEVSSADNSDADENDPDKSKKKKKKSKKKHKHKDKKHKKKSKKHSSDSESEPDAVGGKKNKRHKKKLKKRKHSSSNSTDSDNAKVKNELLSPCPKRKRKNSRTSSFEGIESKTVFDLVHSVVIKNEPGVENNNKFESKLESPKSPELPHIFTNPDDDLKETNVPRLLEKTDHLPKGKIQIKDLKNSAVYNETVKEVENKQKEKAALMEDGELSDSDFDHRTPTLSPTPPSGSLASPTPSSNTDHRNPVKRDLRLMLNQKVKAKSGTERSRSRKDRNSRDGDHKDHHTSKDVKNRDRKRSRSCHSKDRKDSDSLYSRKHSKSRDRERQRTRSNDRRYRDRSNDRRLPRSRERSSRYSESHFDSWSRDDKSRDRQWRGRSRSNERKERIEIDKKKLLEIARKNAITMIKRGTLPLAQQDKAIAAIQAGGKSVEELIDFCKSLSKSEALGELSSVSSDNGGSDTEKGFHHPFLLKERPNSIVMNIRDSKQLPTKTFQERTAESSNQLRLQFPVSSGQQHRKTENEWVEVIPPAPVKKPEPKKTFVPGSAPLQPQAFSIIPPVNSGAGNSAPKPAPVVDPVVAAPVPLPPAPPVLPVVAPLPPTVFPQPVVENVDIGTIVSQRLAAMRKLRENPHDVEALTEMYHAQSEMKTWAESKQMPGQFTGSTGVKVLSAAELTSGYQAWARKDQLTSAQPVSGGMGMALLQKMGWRPGEGLGKNKEGTLEPLQLEVKLDKRGLVSNQDVGVRPGKTVGKPIIPTIKTLEGKHPVSLLGEYCSKRKFGAPVYELCFECGPDHKKNFLFKVKVNGIEYKPTVASPNKKQAKAEAAQICLQTLGLLPSQG